MPVSPLMLPSMQVPQGRATLIPLSGQHLSMSKWSHKILSLVSRLTMTSWDNDLRGIVCPPLVQSSSPAVQAGAGQACCISACLPLPEAKLLSLQICIPRVPAQKQKSRPPALLGLTFQWEGREPGLPLACVSVSGTCGYYWGPSGQGNMWAWNRGHPLGPLCQGSP